MKASLSILLPVHNAQSTVGDAIGRLLEILPELTNRFEIIVIDDGSSDATCEVADDWARHYPQVSFFRQATLSGWQAAVLKHAWRARGEYLMLLCGDLVDAAAINTVWGRRDEMSATVPESRTSDGRTLRIDQRQSRPKGKSPEAAPGALARGDSCANRIGPSAPGPSIPIGRTRTRFGGSLASGSRGGLSREPRGPEPNQGSQFLEPHQAVCTGRIVGCFAPT